MTREGEAHKFFYYQIIITILTRLRRPKPVFSRGGGLGPEGNISGAMPAFES
jgi:hypothetical protein